MALQESSSFLEVPLSSVDPSAERPRVTVWIRGEHDIATRPVLMDTLAQAIDHDPYDLVIDLSLVEFMDASTIGAVVEARNLLRERSRELTVHHPSPAARRVLEICGLDGLIDAEELQTDVRSGALGTWVHAPVADPQRPPSPARPGT